MVNRDAGKMVRIGILSNEFFDLSSGRMGGFGWAARQVIKYFSENTHLNIEVVILSGNNPGKAKEKNDTIHGVRIIHREKNAIEHFRALKKARIDLILAIDFRSSYRKILYRLPFTPVLVWVRDPRTKEDMKKIQSIRYPEYPDLIPEGLDFVNCTSLSRVIKYSSLYGRKISLAATTPYLLNKIPETYGSDVPSASVLPNIIQLDSSSINKSPTPEVVFLGRLDPYKRPWLFAELAKRFPHVKFTFLGQPHFSGQDKWMNAQQPENLHFAGHVGEEEKREYLSRAWALVNTSVHEGLAVSFLEALKMETPVLSSVNPENTVSRFGIFTGNFQGDGSEGLPYFTEGLSKLINDSELRVRLGQNGREWVEQVHNGDRFFNSFSNIAGTLGVEV